MNLSDQQSNEASDIKERHRKIKEILKKKFTRSITDYERYETNGVALKSHHITCYEKGCDNVTEEEYELWELEPPHFFHLMCNDCILRKKRAKRIKRGVIIWGIIIILLTILIFLIGYLNKDFKYL